MSHQSTRMYHVILYSFLSFYFSSQSDWQAGVRELQPSRSRPTDGIPCWKKVNGGNESQPGQVLTPEHGLLTQTFLLWIQQTSGHFFKDLRSFDQICWNNLPFSRSVGDDPEACGSQDGSPSSDMTFEPDGTMGAVSEAFMYFSRTISNETQGSRIL